MSGENNTDTNTGAGTSDAATDTPAAIESMVAELETGLGFGPEEAGEEGGEGSDTPNPADNGGEGGAPVDETPEAKAAREASEQEAADAAALAASRVPAPVPGTKSDPTLPPKSWKKEVSAEWSKLSPAVQAEIHRREDDFHRGLGEYKTEAGFAREFKGVFQPYKEVFQKSGVNPLALTSQLLEAQHTLAFGAPEAKIQLVRDLIQDYQIDFNALIQTPATPSEVLRLRAENRALQSSQTTAAQQQNAERMAQVTSELEAFAADPAHPYVEELATDIAVFIQGGATLADAYEKAVWANPKTRAKEQDRLRKGEEDKRRADEAARVQKAKQASAANVRSAPRQARTTAAVTDSIEDTLRATFKEISSR